MVRDIAAQGYITAEGEPIANLSNLKLYSDTAHFADSSSIDGVDLKLALSTKIAIGRLQAILGDQDQINEVTIHFSKGENGLLIEWLETSPGLETYARDNLNSLLHSTPQEKKDDSPNFSREQTSAILEALSVPITPASQRTGTQNPTVRSGR